MEKTKWVRLYMSCNGCKGPFIYKNRTICEDCKEAFYCSIECFYNDKISHKKNCKGVGPDALKTLNVGPDISKVFSREKWLIQKATGISEGSFILCLNCDKKCVVENVTCYKCRSVFYCSQDCFEKDRPDHRLRCELAALFHYVDESLFHGQTYEMLKKKGFNENFFISPFMDRLRHEFAPMFTGLLLERSVIILQIVGPYPHSWRFAILARDIRGITIHIIFHDEQKTEASMTGGPNLEPQVVTMVPLASCLKPGNFIILLDAWLHTFQDFTTGIRIDSLQKVHFVWKD